MIDISQQAKLESTALQSDSVWIALLEIQLPTITFRVAQNTDKITWGGFDWQPFPFEIGDVVEDAKGETPYLTVRVANETRALQSYVEVAKGANDSVVILRVVNSKHLEGDAEIEEEFTVASTTCDNHWITFSLGGDAILSGRFPPRRILKNKCPYVYKGIECGATSTLTDCPKHLAGCVERKNDIRFGGEPNIPQGGLYVK